MCGFLALFIHRLININLNNILKITKNINNKQIYIFTIVAINPKTFEQFNMIKFCLKYFNKEFFFTNS